MIIRLDKKHYPQIIEIWESSVRATHHFLKPEEIGFYKPLVLQYALPENTLFGTCDNNRLTGLSASAVLKWKCCLFILTFSDRAWVRNY